MVKWCPGAAWTVCRVFTPPSSTKCLYGVPGAITGTQRHGHCRFKTLANTLMTI